MKLTRIAGGDCEGDDCGSEDCPAIFVTDRGTIAWLVRVRHFRDTGRWIGRVHLISRPLSDYLRYEFAVYSHTVQAGEDVRILDVTDQPNPGLPMQDYWLFDDTTVVRMDYAPDGTQLGRELLEGVDPGPYVAWKQLALKHAERFTDDWMNRQA
jgi:hypothetical protein